jgi:hypothetical protein
MKQHGFEACTVLLEETLIFNCFQLLIYLALLSCSDSAPYLKKMNEMQQFFFSTATNLLSFDHAAAYSFVQQ